MIRSTTHSAQKYRAMLAAERKGWKKQLKSGAVDRQTYQRKLTPMNKVDGKLERVAFEQGTDLAGGAEWRNMLYCSA